jgi:hypothetical protein
MVNSTTSIVVVNAAVGLSYEIGTTNVGLLAQTKYT